MSVHLRAHPELASALADCCPRHLARLAVHLDSRAVELLPLLVAFLGLLGSNTDALKLLPQSRNNVGAVSKAADGENDMWAFAAVGLLDSLDLPFDEIDDSWHH